MCHLVFYAYGSPVCSYDVKSASTTLDKCLFFFYGEHRKWSASGKWSLDLDLKLFYQGKQRALFGVSIRKVIIIMHVTFGFYISLLLIWNADWTYLTSSRCCPCLPSPPMDVTWKFSQLTLSRCGLGSCLRRCPLAPWRWWGSKQPPRCLQARWSGTAPHWQKSGRHWACEASGWNSQLQTGNLGNGTRRELFR